MQYVKEKYGSELEFLWEKFPKNAILRNKNNSKWYVVLLNIPKQKLGIVEEGNIDIIGVKCEPILIDSLKKMKGYFSGYHMNKKHWITVLLNGSVPINDILKLIDSSYLITNK